MFSGNFSSISFSFPRQFVSPSFIDEEGGYSSDETKCHIPWVTGLIHLIKLNIYLEQLFWTWQDRAVATVNSLLGAGKAGEYLRSVTPRSNVLWPRVDESEGRVYVDWSLIRGNLLGDGSPSGILSLYMPARRRGASQKLILLVVFYLRGYRIGGHLR